MLFWLPWYLPALQSEQRPLGLNPAVSACSPQPQLEGSTGFVCWARGFMEIPSAPGQEAVVESLQSYCSSEATPPLLLFPEEDTTNGRAGLLKFKSVQVFFVFFFSFTTRVASCDTVERNMQVHIFPFLNNVS